MRRPLLAALLVSCIGLLALLSFQSGPLPYPEVSVSFRTPYTAEPLLGAYTRIFRAELRGDLDTLRQYVKAAPSSFLLYRTLLDLARNPQLPAAERLAYMERVLAFGLISPLERSDTRRAQLELAQIAEAAAATPKAVTAYLAALPLEAAAAGLRRLESNPRKLARLFLEAGEAERALHALRGVAAPALRAPALAATGDDPSALAAYNRWLLRAPDDPDALEGKVAVLISLERYGAARTLLERLPQNLELELTLAEAQDDDAAALAIYLQLAAAGSEYSAWQATELLERRGDPAAALPLYLDLARGTSDYQDDAAYRAYVLAERLGETETAAVADALISPLSYFGLLREKPAALPNAPLPRVTPPVLARAEALQRAGDPAAALGELLLALGRADDEPTAIALAEALQARGEFGASAEAAGTWLDRGSRARRTYLAAYPRAYRQTVSTQAQTQQVPPTLIWAIMRQESLFYPRAVSTSEAQGLLQVVPDTWTWLAEGLGEAAADPFSPAQNIRYGAFYLSQLLGTFGGDLPESAAAYNGGPGYIGGVLDDPQITTSDDFYRFIGRSETREYVQRVMLNAAIYEALYGGRMDTKLGNNRG